MRVAGWEEQNLRGWDPRFLRLLCPPESRTPMTYPQAHLLQQKMTLLSRCFLCSDVQVTGAQLAIMLLLGEMALEPVTSEPVLEGQDLTMTFWHMVKPTSFLSPLQEDCAVCICSVDDGAPCVTVSERQLFNPGDSIRSVASEP